MKRFLIRLLSRFFLILSILMIVFLVLTAGSIAAVHYWSIQTYKPVPPFVFGWGITEIPYNGNRVVYPSGILYIVQEHTSQAIGIHKVVLVTIRDGKVQGIMSGLVTGTENGAYQVEGAGGYQVTVSPDDVKGIYVTGNEWLLPLLNSLRSPLSIATFTLVLAASIALWRALPGKPAQAGLSGSDGEISSNLY